MLAKVGETQEDDGQGTTCLTGPHHVDEETGEHPAVLIQRCGQTTPFVDTFAHLRESFFQARVFCLLNEGRQ